MRSKHWSSLNSYSGVFFTPKKQQNFNEILGQVLFAENFRNKVEVCTPKTHEVSVKCETHGKSLTVETDVLK